MKLAPVQIPPRPQGLRVQAFALAEPRFQVRVPEAVIELFDQIGEPGIMPAQISAALRQIGDRRVTVMVNSLGGSFFDGLTIHNLLLGHRAGVSVEVLGIAASAAALVAVAGDQVSMAKSSQLMIHQASGGVVGNASAMRQVADVLDKIDGLMTDIFVNRTGLDRQTVSSMLADETFMSADEAVGFGFADRLLDRDAIAAPRVTSSGAQAVNGHIESKAELESLLRTHGLPRSIVKVGAGAMWAKMRGEPEPEPQPESIDLDAVIDAIVGGVAAAMPPRRTR